jgi:phosphonate transport system ATP-binding protein
VKVLATALEAQHPAARPGAAPAIANINVQIARGEQVAVIGASGSGKTTLLHALACALRPRAGQLLLDDHDVWAADSGALQRIRASLFLAPQTPPLPPRQRVVTSVLAGRLPHQSLLTSLKSLFYPNDIAGAEQALTRFDVADKIFERVDRLSGGERQRVGLARALLSNASLFLVDEPLSALDPTRAQLAISSLTAAARERGATLVCTLHQVDMALAHFPRIIGLRDGALAFDLPAQSVSAELLRNLYANKLDELHGPAPTDLANPPDASQPVVMHCR